MAKTQKTPPAKNGAKKNTNSAKNTSAAQKQTPPQQKKDSRAHRQVGAIVLFASAILSLCVATIPGANLWEMLHNLAVGLFGVGIFFWPIALVYVAVICALDKPFGKISHKVMQACGLICLICSAVFIFKNQLGDGYFRDIADTYTSFGYANGGAVGALIGGAFLRLFGMVPAAVVVLLLAFVFLMLTTGTTLVQLFRLIWSPVKKIETHAAEKIERADERRKARPFNIDVPVDDEALTPQPAAPSDKAAKKPRAPFDVPMDDEVPPAKKPADTSEVTGSRPRAPFDVPVDLYPVNPNTGEVCEPEKAPAQQDETDPPEWAELIKTASEVSSGKKGGADSNPEPKASQSDSQESAKAEPQEVEEVPAYRFPPIDLLVNSASDGDADVEDELKSNAAKLVDTLKSFGVETTIIGISRGPAVTRYELKPASGVKINKITNLADDIALNLAASGVRIEAPIPNKSAVGIEIPNRTTSIVPMRELIDSPKFTGGRSKLTVVLGKDITGNATVTDLAKMPHLLIAGSTGSGKSVCINSLIMSVLYKATPDEVKLLMIDPKVVELGVYNGIPHLLVPVVTDPRKASGALSWAVNEMLNRYKMFADNNVRDLTAYNKMCANFPEKKPLPQVLIIIDELADLMMAAPNEVEDSICRLAQMARAAGMHLVIATQRPSVDVITGIIKANIPSRIAFAVSSQVDSRTILDTSGAEKLLGRGDMLFYPVGASKPTRVQGCYVTDSEIEAVIDYVKNSSSVEECVYDENIAKEIDRQAAPEKKKGGASGGGEDGEFGDEMLPQAIECVVEMGSASTTLLQRRLRLGYARAARIMDELEQRGIVGPAEGSKQRKVLITKQQWLEMSTRSDDDAI